MKWKIALSIACTGFFLVGSTSGAFAGPLLKVGTTESSKYEDAMAVDCPRPEIPAELHEQCFKSCCIARFLIKADGKSSVKLISSSGSEEVDDIAIDTLRRWRFKPALLDGKPVESTRKIKVEFEVE
jgi:protein TonB